MLPELADRARSLKNDWFFFAQRSHLIEIYVHWDREGELIESPKTQENNTHTSEACSGEDQTILSRKRESVLPPSSPTSAVLKTCPDELGHFHSTISLRYDHSFHYDDQTPSETAEHWDECWSGAHSALFPPHWHRAQRSIQWLQSCQPVLFIAHMSIRK